MGLNFKARLSCYYQNPSSILKPHLKNKANVLSNTFLSLQNTIWVLQTQPQTCYIWIHDSFLWFKETGLTCRISSSLSLSISFFFPFVYLPLVVIFFFNMYLTTFLALQVMFYDPSWRNI